MYIKKLKFIFFFLITTAPSLFAQAFQLSNLTYDHVPLNQNTWSEVDMVYWTHIHGHTYKNTVQLLRPKTYLKKYHMKEISHQVTLTFPEIGLNHTQVTITAIKPAPTFKRCHKNTCSQVIGLFKHYANHVKTYRFKDLTTGNISIIHATPNHPFYVKNKQQFIPISEVTGNDQLVGKKNHTITLICATNQINDCGITYNNQRPTMVYNLEVYRQHHYEVGQDDILVHNTCDDNLTIDSLREKGTKIGDGGYKEVYTLPNSDGYVYSFFKNGNTVFGKETAIERTLRVAREVNLDVPEFKIEAVGVNKDILKMTKLEIKSELLESEQRLLDDKIDLLYDTYNRIIGDDHLDNIGWLNGQPVLFDVDEIYLIQPLDPDKYMVFDDLSFVSKSEEASIARLEENGDNLISYDRIYFPKAGKRKL